jgi:anaerobic ribonucleoside-triphosphate reductase activating protein
MSAEKLKIGGFVPFTATDYPDHLAAVVFCQGCPWRCGYCHNPHLLPTRSKEMHDWSAIAAFLETRRGLLDAVVFSGGEPTLQDALPAAMRAVRDMGFRVGLHTAGIYPRKLAAVLPLVDWVGMDVKAPFGAYERVTGVVKSGVSACESAKLVIASGIAHEFRTTVDRSVIGAADLALIADTLPRMGAKRYVLQTCRV